MRTVDDYDNSYGDGPQEPPREVEPQPLRTVTTANSVYQINEADHMIRRVTGANDPTPRQGTDGEWREYRALGLMLDGLLIVWGDNPDGSAATTWTSKVVGDTNG